MNGLNATSELVAVQRQEGVVGYLRDQLRDVQDGMSLRSLDQLQSELEAAEAKLKRLRGGQCRQGAVA